MARDILGPGLDVLGANNSALLIEVNGVYPARSGAGAVVFVGPDDPAGAAVNGDVWINTSGV